MTIVNKHIITKNVVCKLHNNYWKRFYILLSYNWLYHTNIRD